MKKSILFLALLLLLLTLSCGGGSSSGGGGSQGSGWPNGDYNYLNQHNASNNAEIIVRWETPILVNTNGISGMENSFRQWGLPFSFVNYNPSEGIIVNIGDPGSGNCGVTNFQWYRSNGRMFSAVITISSNLSSMRCGDTKTHEIGHAIGFLDHTSDGGLMDRSTYLSNDQITAPVRNMINLLYALPVGTNITPMLSAKRPSIIPKLEYKRIRDGGEIVTRVIE
jgi:hypothetical protein